MKQRHTSKRIYERLRDEHGFAGGMTIVNHCASIFELPVGAGMQRHR